MVKIALDQVHPPTRREFCAQACRAATLLAAGTFAACDESVVSPSGGNPLFGSITGSVSGRTVSVQIDGGTVLQTVGSAAIVQTTVGTYLVGRTGQDVFTAVTATCTHEGCSITGYENNLFVCPCHGSRFTPAGTVVVGPATRPLQSYGTQFAGGMVTFPV
jgi:cytochrome b6-f complex iron-sulfur subunit